MYFRIDHEKNQNPETYPRQNLNCPCQNLDANRFAYMLNPARRVRMVDVALGRLKEWLRNFGYCSFCLIWR